MAPDSPVAVGVQGVQAGDPDGALGRRGIVAALGSRGSLGSHLHIAVLGAPATQSVRW